MLVAFNENKIDWWKSERKKIIDFFQATISFLKKNFGLHITRSPYIFTVTIPQSC